MRIFVLTLGLTAILGTSLRADEKPFLHADHWEGLTQFWKVEGSTVTGTSPPEGLKFNTFLCSKKKYKDFELSFQIRLKDGAGNSGIQIRSQIVDMKNFAVGGPQCDIGANYWGSLYGERFSKEGKIGGGHMMKASDAKAINAVLKKNDFNEYSIKCVGKHVTIVVNGVTAVDGEFSIMPDDGIIAFQLHAGGHMQVTFKNIKFKELK